MRNYNQTIKKAIKFIETQMKTFDNGYYGIYERIRIDEHIRTNWSRPDCNTEYMRVLETYRDMTGDNQYQSVSDNLLNWLERTQDKVENSVWKGSLPFYVIDGYIREPKIGETIYQNDNGKVIIILCSLYKKNPNPRYLEIAEGVAGYWFKAQQPDGTYGVVDSKCVEICRKGPCFVQWLVTAFYSLYEITKKDEYLQSAEKGMKYLLSLVLENGRSLTTYEVIKMENWRPVSSETGNTVYTLAIAYSITKNPVYLEKLKLVADYLISLQHESGAILNCKKEDKEASQQNNENLCDLVYTAGFSLQALYHSYEVTNDKRYLECAFKLGDFLASIQCENECELWNGAWRGSYNVVTKAWDGRANQNNSIDEGGMYSVYTGWTVTNIVYGLQLLQQHMESEE